MLVVIGLATLLLGLSVPALSSLRNAKNFSQDAQLLADMLALARSHALAKGRTVDVGFQSNQDGTYVAVGERDGSNFHPISRTQRLDGLRLDAMSPLVNPASRFPEIQDSKQGSFGNVIRFNSRGEARIRSDGVDRELVLQILPNVGDPMAGGPVDNQIEVIIHGLSGGISLARPEVASPQ